MQILDQRGVTKEHAVAHWRRVLKTPGLMPLSYEYARACLKALGAIDEFDRLNAAREPGAD